MGRVASGGGGSELEGTAGNNQGTSVGRTGAHAGIKR